MKTLRRLTTVIVLTCLICNAVSLGEESDKAKKELKFEISSNKYNPRKYKPMMSPGMGGGGMMAGMGPGMFGGSTEAGSTGQSKMIKPTHAALMGASQQLFSPSCLAPDAILATAWGKEMSDLQKEYVKQGNACGADYSHPGFSGSILGVSRLNRTHLFAVSEDDAKKMAAAFIESWQNNMGAEVQKLLEKKKEFESKAVELRKGYEEKRKEFDELKKTLKEKSSKGIHSLDGDVVYNSKAKDMARDAARDLYLKLDAANIEIEVIKVRLSAATVYQARGNLNPAVHAKLEEIMCEQTIELAGALKRQEGITDTLRQEEEVYRLYVQFAQAGWSIEKFNQDARVAESNLKRATEEFDNIDSSYPSVEGNKVTIRPVEPQKVIEKDSQLQ